MKKWSVVFSVSHAGVQATRKSFHHRVLCVPTGRDGVRGHREPQCLHGSSAEEDAGVQCGEHALADGSS